MRALQLTSNGKKPVAPASGIPTYPDMGWRSFEISSPTSSEEQPTLHSLLMDFGANWKYLRSGRATALGRPARSMAPRGRCTQYRNQIIVAKWLLQEGCNRFFGEWRNGVA